MSLLKRSLKSLKKRLDSQSSLTIQRDDGINYKVQFIFNEPATREQLDKLPWSIPSEYKEFLSLHNGSRLFLSEDTTFELFSIDEVLEHYSYYTEWPKNWFPIGAGFDGELLIIAPQDNKNGYIFWAVVGDSFEYPCHIGELKFDDWLNYFIVSQGSKFWDWH
ncbi:hypothetical protein BTS2_0936 [Bacillus sp. TS-2]|nr:hypothetical protein BTS2_0936 [Bacillus sp. TS-2]